MNTKLNFIGQIRTPYQSIDECPNNISFNGPLCRIEINDELVSELIGLHQNQQILILYWLGQSEEPAGFQCMGSEQQAGTFAMRTPFRPNPIGAAVLPIEKIEDATIEVRGLDCLDLTKLIDIKPAIFNERFKETLSRNEKEHL